MESIGVFLFGESPGQGIVGREWLALAESMVGWMAIWSVLGVILVAGVYTKQVRGHLIRSTNDLLGGFEHRKWLWLAIVPGLLFLATFAWQLGERFPEATGLVSRGLWASVCVAGLCGLISYGLMLVPGLLTPSCYRYLPYPRFLLPRKESQ